MIPKKTNADEEMQWFVLRDLKRPNALRPAYKMLAEEGLEVFTPKRWIIRTVRNKRERLLVPVIPDLLFAHSSRSELDPIIHQTSTLQYRFFKGGGYGEPMRVATREMERFIMAVSTSDSPRYYTPEEITSAMIGRKIRIIDGPMNGYEGRLLNIRGSRKKRLMVELPNILTVAVEVNPEYIEFVD
ncbi:MAG: UpxY family transcription antiterminator [Bacteroidales bacterium]|nr:UpxY family transcription antiterminator [Bacteroidales bacterium]